MPNRISDVRRYFRDLAESTWEWQRESFALRRRAMREETITEMLVQCMKRDLPQSGIRVHEFTSREESKEGADWEWFFRRNTSMVGFRVQAKRLYRNGRYGIDFHHQINNLIDRARDDSKNPIYVFYNHDFMPYTHLFLCAGWSYPSFCDPSYWGCSIAKASFVRHIASSTLPRLRPGMAPWHTLFGLREDSVSADYCSAKVIMDLLPSDPDPSRGSDEFLFLTQPPDWVDLVSPARLRDPEEQLNLYLRKNDLAGVISIDASNYRSR